MTTHQAKSVYTKIVAAIPHGVANAAYWQWQENPAARAWRDRWTDWFTDELFGLDRPGVTVVKSRLARLDCDVERLEDESDRLTNFVRIADDELLKKSVEANPHWRNGFLAEWYRYRAEVLAASATGATLIVDCHSFPSDLAPNIDICIGFNEDASKPAVATLELVAHIFRDAGYSVAFNRPYANALAPLGYIGHSLMIEVNKHTYMNEQTHEKSARFNHLLSTIGKVYHALLKMCEPNSNGNVSSTTPQR